jgi:hypothetical protein
MKTAEDFGPAPERAQRSGHCFNQLAVEHGLASKGPQFPYRPAWSVEVLVIPAGASVAVRRLFARWRGHAQEFQGAWQTLFGLFVPRGFSVPALA